MPDYTDQNLVPLDPLHHVEGLVSLSDRVARRKKEQERRRQQKHRRYEEESTEADVPSEPGPPGSEIDDDNDEHIDFCA